VHKRKPDYLNPKATYHFEDIRKENVLAKHLRDADVVVHLAAMVVAGREALGASKNELFADFRQVPPGDLTDEIDNLVRLDNEGNAAPLTVSKLQVYEGLAIREVDAGSCNGCELEITGLTSPVYDSERFGVHFVASPRHADMLLVTGPVTRNMVVPLVKTYEATPAPKLVVAIGDCARSCGVFRGAYGVAGSVDQIIPVDVFVDGCPPEPADILRGILAAVGRR